MKKIAAIQTIKYIWTHPNSRKKQIQPVLKYFGWKLYKSLTHRHLDVQMLPDIKIRCYPKSYSSDCVIYCGVYDYNEMNFLLNYLRDGDSFIDIGANIGVYTLLAASKIHSGSIYSFEVFPENYARLQENLRLNQFEQVKTYAIAVSDKSGTIALNPAGGDSLPFITDSVSGNTITVPTDTLDNLIQNQPLPNFTLAKMDIEGAELLALKGATSLLKGQHPYVWILEINHTVRNFGHSQQDLVDFLQSYDYSFYNYNADTNYLIPINLKEKKGNNILAIANSYIDFVRNRLAEM
ncbi:MAG: FkbM family methyltransferase, partial [Rhizonema sp. PD38]|nr:FkbM family methyltransferase [Rhizonema sp. PD38]